MQHDWHERLSQPRFAVSVEKNLKVRARDGITLAVDVYRPDAPGHFPALVGLSPYGKDLQGLLLPPQTLGESAVWDGNIEAGDLPFFVSRGYVVVVGDLRGTGSSEGAYRGFFNKTEGEDGYDVVEWAAEQAWCDGNVGMVGRSYFAQVQVETAIQAPPHLKTICPISEFNDFYRDMAYHGGVPGIFLYGLWDGRGGTSGCARKNPVSVVIEAGKEAMEAARAAALADPDIASYPNFFHLLHYPEKNPPYFDVLLHPFDGAFHAERSTYPGLDRIKVPVLLGGSFGNINAKSCWKTFAGLRSEKRLVVNGKSMADRPWREDHGMLLRWYDHWLKGIDTGMLAESAPIRIFVYGENAWRDEQEWPLLDTNWRPFYLQGRRRLGETPECAASEPDSFLQEPLHLTNRKGGLTYETLPLARDLTVIGPAALHFFAAIDQPDTTWIVKVALVRENGTAQPLGTSYLKASHSEVDRERSSPGRPFHPHTRAIPVPANEVQEYQIELDPIACVFREGDRIRLTIESMESALDEEMVKHYHPHLCSSRTTVHKIYRNERYRSRLLLPVIEGT